MTAYDHLVRTGELDDAGGLMLYRVVRAVGVGRGDRPPEGHDRWDGDAVIELAHAFLTDDRTPSRLAYLIIHAADDRSMELLLNRMVLNYLRDEGRRTEVGKLIRRLNDVLGASDTFARSPNGRWALANGPQAPSVAPAEALKASASAVDGVTTPRWRDSARRGGPVADFDSLVRLSEAVLGAAGGSIATADLARAMLARVGLTPAPIVSLLDVSEPVDATHTSTIEMHATQVEAREVFESLSETERRIMATVHLPTRDLYDVIGLRKSQAGASRLRTVELVTSQTAHLADPTAVRLHLLDIAQQWLRDRAQTGGSTS